MEQFDLAYVNGQHAFARRPDGMETGPYPVHMELNEWARVELAKYCESHWKPSPDLSADWGPCPHSSRRSVRR